MKKFIAPVLILFCLVLAGISFFVWHNTWLALIACVLGVVVWTGAPSGLGEDPPRGVKSDPKAVKEYRRRNPSATIADGIRATTEGQK